MTTFTLNGFSVEYDGNDDPIAVGTASLVVTFPDNQAVLNYTILGTEPDDIPTVDLGGTDALGALLNGAPINEAAEEFLGSIVTPEGTHTIVVFFDPATNQDFIFQIGGDPLTLPTTLPGFLALEDSITSLGAATGAFAPEQDILFSSLLGVSSTEDDLIVVDNDEFFVVNGGLGDDTIDMIGLSTSDGYVEILYAGLAGPITVDIDGAANTGTVIKSGVGTDTLIGVQNPLVAGNTNGGLLVEGTAEDDTFNLNIDGGQWMEFRPGDGQDAINLTGDGIVRLSFSEATNGIDVDLRTNTINDDGFGNTEIITGNTPWGIRGSAFDDVFIGSDADDNFRKTGGNDDVHGGGGSDRLRYESSLVQSVSINAQEGTASGTLVGGDTFNDTFSGFERFRGSSGNDVIVGDAQGNVLEGRNGEDTLGGGFGNDFYRGGSGADTFVFSGGFDSIDDFEVGIDTLLINIPGVTQDDVNAAFANPFEFEGRYFAPFGETGNITFNGLTPEQISLIQATLGDGGLPTPTRVIEGTDGNDDLVGTDGNDLIITGDNAGGDTGFDFVSGSTGDDTIDMSDITNGYVGIGYGGLDRIDAVIDGGANTGSVAKFVAGNAAGTDTLTDVENPLFSGFTIGGLSIRGTNGDDTFDVTPQGEQWMSLLGGGGVDSFSINGTGLVRLDFRDANQGIEINLGNATGQIVNDGFGNTETITGTSSVWDIQGSGFDDVLIGSGGDESYTAFGGNNTLDGGGGFDRVRYDRGTIASVNIDAENGLVSGTLSNGGTFTDTISGFEHLRGSDGNDQITGESSVDNLIEGQEGTDTFVHLGGNDTIADFDVANETLIVRLAGLDQAAVDAAIANATDVAASHFDAETVFPPIESGALVDFGGGNTVSFSNLSAADLAGADVQFVAPGAANLVQGTDGDDNLVGTAGDDLIITGDNPSGDNVVGSGGNDEIDFSGITGDPGGFVVVDYSGIGTTIDVSLDGGDNTASVVKAGLGTDTLIDVNAPLFAGWTTGGLSIVGTDGNDTFDVSPEGEQWMSIQPGDGIDTIIVNSNGTERLEGGDPIGALRLDMRDGFGIDVNLATRTIADDGFDNEETIGGTAPIWEVWGSGGDDFFLGSDNAESFRSNGGNDNLDGGLGFDRLRYDGFIQSVSIDAVAGIVTGILGNGDPFTDTISGFEHFRGTQGDDSFIGTDEDERFEGGQGSDTITAGGGDDTLAGGEGDATLNGGSGSDIFFVGNGRTVIEDFNAAEDFLDFSFTGLGIIGRNTVLSNATDNGGETTVDLGNGGNLIFGNLTVSEVQALADPDAGTPPPPPTTPIAWTVGDPHLLTLDGVGYDFHAIGEFVLLRGTSGGGFSNFEIQSRMGPVLDDLGDPVPNVSANIAIAARLGNGSEVMIDAADASPLSIGGVVRTISDGDAIEVGNDLISRDGDTYTVVFAGADGTVGAGDARLSVIVRDGFVDMGVQISADMAGQVEGLLGDGNGNPDDDIALADGNVLERPLAFEDLYGDFRDDWRVTTEDQSLFTYDAGETLAGFYDPAAPSGGPTDGATEEELGAARQAVENAGLTPGTLAFDNAVQDFLLTGDDRFIESSSGETAPTPENTGSAGTLAQGEERVTLNVTLTDEVGTGLDGAVVNFSAGGAPVLGQAAGAGGSYDVRLGSSTTEGRVDALRSYNEDTDADITVGDALNALRLAVGLNPSFGDADPMNFIAADVNRDGDVGVSDALDILRFAVGLQTENAPRWVFLDDAQDLSGTNKDNVQYNTGKDTGLIADNPGVQLTGVLLGDLSAQPDV